MKYFLIELGRSFWRILILAKCIERLPSLGSSIAERSWIFKDKFKRLASIAHMQCEQIWLNFRKFGHILSLWPFIKGLFCIFESALANFKRNFWSIFQCFNKMAKYWTNNLSICSHCFSVNEMLIAFDWFRRPRFT